MASFNTVWSIDLGKASLKAVRLRREKNNVEILAVDKIDYPVGANGVDTVQQAKEALNAFKVRNDVRDPVVVAHPGQGTFSRFIKVPAFEAKKLKEMVGYEASQQIPFPLDEVIWDYHLINREYLAGEEREVGIFAVRREAIDDYLLDFTSEGLAVESLTIGYLGLINYVFYDLAPQEPSIVLDIGATHTDLVLIDGKRFWIRALPHSGNDLNKAIMERFKLSFQEAEKLKVESGKAPQQAVKIFSTVIQPKLKELVGEIQRSSGYYRSQAGDVKFQRLYLVGNGSRIFGIKKYLSEQLGIPVDRVQTIKHFRVSRDVDLKLLQAELPAFATAFGCGLQGVGIGACRVDLIPQEERLQKDLRRKKKHAFIAMGAVYAAIIFCGAVILDGKVKSAQDVVAEHTGWIKDKVEKFDPKKVKKGTGPQIDQETYEKLRHELEGVGETRRLALEALRSLGAVVPAENAQGGSETGTEKESAAAADKAVAKGADLNKKKVFIPWIKVDRAEWPPEAAEANAGSKGEAAKKKLPIVPSYRVRLFAAVTVRPDVEQSQADLRKLFIEPLRKKLKESPEITIDSEVKESGEYLSGEKYIRLPYRPTKERGDRDDSAGGALRVRKEIDETIPQKFGPFFGTEVSFYLRLREPKEEVAEVKPKAADEEDSDSSSKKKKPKPK